MTDFERVATVIEFLSEQHGSQPTLDELAATVDLSPYHFQRMFVRWAGVSPKKFVQSLTANAVKKRLQSGQTVLDASLDAGLSGPGRLHDLTVSLESATPGEIKAGGEGWTITLGFASSPFGDCLIANSPRGICRLDFVDRRDRESFEHKLSMDWPNARLSWCHPEAEALAERIFFPAPRERSDRGLRCFVRGSRFQLRVWRSLLSIPVGQLATYSQIAKAIDAPSAFRAAGTAIGNNPVGYLIPCHRVIQKTGVVGQYRWGETRKRAVIAHEFSGCQAD